MKKPALLTICLLLVLTCAASSVAEPLANEGLGGLYAKSIEQVLRLEPDDIDLGTAALIISEQWSDVVPGRRYQSKLDDIALEIRKRCQQQNIKSHPQMIQLINKYLFDELGFKTVEEANDLFLHSVLDRKKGYCLSLSVLYLAIGERLGLPLYGVVVPGHFFVRYDNGAIRFNIESTSKGGYADDNHYIEEFKVPENNRHVYLENLNKRQTLGCFFNNLGNSYNDVGNADQAMVALERAVEINPSLAESRANLGNIYLSKGRVNDAIYEYRKALEINPTDAKTHNNIGNAYLQKEWTSDAVNSYARSIKLDPQFIDAYKNIAIAYSKQQMYAYAASNLQQAVALAPRDAACYRQLADVYSLMQDYDLAISNYNRAIFLKSDFAEAWLGLGLTYNKLDRPADEIDAYKKALTYKPDMVPAMGNLGNVYFRKKDYDDAIRMYKKAAALQPDDASLHYNIGAAYSNKSDYENAVDSYLIAVKIDPRMAEAHNGLAFGFYQLKKYDLASQHAQLAQDLGADVSPDLISAIKKKLR
jgi:tetratricopeptide (TPR) repeat protein